MLFQIYTINVLVDVPFDLLVLCCYLGELLVAHTENLKKIIDNINLTRNKKRNFIKLQPVVMYNQKIFRVCQCVIDYCTSFLLPAKVFIIILLTIATTKFVLVCHAVVERLTNAVCSVAETVYNMNWYDADVSTQKDVLILICLNQKALKVELPFIRELSHEAAAMEFKKVYVFYNWILKVTKQRNF
nr:uncharacterized protein LOC111427695 isoform X1 [Onthophagus taurus]